MNTKLSQIEKSLKLKYRLENGVGPDHHGGSGRTSGTDGAGGPPTRAPSAGGGLPAGIGAGDGGSFGHPRNRENERLVEELHRYNSVLLRENGELRTKIKVKASLLVTLYKAARTLPHALRCSLSRTLVPCYDFFSCSCSARKTCRCTRYAFPLEYVFCKRYISVKSVTPTVSTSVQFTTLWCSATREMGRDRDRKKGVLL